MRSVVAISVGLLLVLAPGAAADGGGRAESVAFGAGRLWTNVRDGVVAVDPATGKTAPVIRTAAYGTVIAATDRTVWQLHSDTLTKIDAATGARRWRVRVPHSPEAVTTGARSVWLVSTGRWHSVHGGAIVPDGRGILVRLDPTTGVARARVLVDRGPTAIAFGSGGAWVLNGRGLGADDTLDRIDARTNGLVASIRVPHWSSAVAVGRRFAWVVSEPKSAGGTITRIDLRTNRGVTRPLPHSWIPQAVALASGGVWVADPGVAQLIRIDPHTLRVV